MNTCSNQGLNQPPLHPKFPQRFARKEVERNVSIQQSIEDMDSVDQEFMYEQRKNNLHTERLLTAHLRLIRKFSFLPKGILVQTFNNALKHVYTEIDRAKKEEAKAEKALKALEQQMPPMDEIQLQEIEAIANELSQENN